jgi:biopolymer transport protein ExbB
MTSIRRILSVLCLAASGMLLASPAGAQTPPAGGDAPGAAGGTMTDLSRSAEERLAASVTALNALREQIAADKLPLAQELTSLEERLAQLRKENDRVTRLVDAGNLELPAIRQEIKVRGDELSYVSNILDEYARGFAQKIHVSELQKYGAPLEAAKQAVENTTLSVPEKFTTQLSFVDTSVRRLFDAVGGMRFDGQGVDLKGTVLDGEYALIGPVALFRSKDGATAGVVVPQTGSANPLIRPLDGEMQTQLVSLVETGQGMIPLDPSRGAALKALVQKTSLVYIFKKGGPIMWPLLVCSIIALAVVLERLLFLFLERIRRRPGQVQRILAAVAKGDDAEAIKIGGKSKFFVARALGYALGHKDASLANAIMFAEAKEMKRYQRGIAILDTVITLAPLLGLLGTVTGMMASFALIGGELSAPGAITGGIAEALIATAAGLGIAILALLPFNFLNARMEDARHEIESAGTQLQLLVQQRDSVKEIAAKATAEIQAAAAASGVHLESKPMLQGV